MSDPKTPVPGDVHIDARHLGLIDITTDEMNKMIKVREEIIKAVANLKRLSPEQIERAGLNASDVQRAITMGEQFEQLTSMIPAADKLAEMLVETRATRGHDLATLLGEIAAQARRRGQRDLNGAEILGPLDDLFAYQYGPGQKGAATRAKNKKLIEESPK